ncbi:MAG: AmmeMemoRadiSam system protein B [Patescibacteria group bacterium]|nr:AmmeMemoRadiSam system protein B [Patescibacteria group bacterium]MDD4611188.1 AmmeMemoRadiSam system protein B [Patescibacteria group bacterium]
MFSKKITILFIIAILLLFTEAGLLLFGAKNKVIDLPKPKFFSNAGQIYGAIMPHHLIVKDKMEEFLSGIKKYNYQTIILIGPNHFERGHSQIITSDQSWQTDSGDFLPDENIIEALAENKIASIDDQTIKGDHSMYNLTPLLKQYWPQAKIVPIILSSTASPQKAEELADFLAKNLNQENSLVLASVDFSHYQPMSVADWHDEKSQAVIESFDFGRVYDLEIDSPPSIYTVLKYLEIIGAEKSELIFHTNSGQLAGSPDASTTSHSFYYFGKGEKADKSLLNFLFFGDLMLDRNVAAKIKKNSLNQIFKNLAGGENRFFGGIDFVSANLEGAVTNGGEHYAPQLENDFAFDPEYIKEIKRNYHFNFFNLANNHFTDQGERGIMETKENLNNLGLNYAGCPDGQTGDCSSKIVEINGNPSASSGQWKIGLAGFSLVYKIPDEEEMKNIVSNLASSTDLTIVSIHWGSEYQHQFNKTQQRIAHELIDAGADMIIGHHPHVVQGVEMYKDKPIFYSLGNFVFDQYFSPDTQEGLAVGLNLTPSPSPAEPHPASPPIRRVGTPLLIRRGDGGEVEINLFPIKSKSSQVELIKGTEKTKFLEKLAGWSEVSDEIKEQIKNGKIKM